MPDSFFITVLNALFIAQIDKEPKEVSVDEMDYTVTQVFLKFTISLQLTLASVDNLKADSLIPVIIKYNDPLTEKPTEMTIAYLSKRIFI